MKQCKENPWEVFNKKYYKNCEIFGVVKSISEFGIFVTLPGDVTGLIHINDIKAKESITKEKIKILFKKNEKIKTKIISIDIKYERIYLETKIKKEEK